MKGKRYIWVNDNIKDASQAVVSLLSPTAQYGINVFESVRGYWNEADKNLYLFRINDHLDRLSRSCRVMGIDLPYKKDYIINAIKQVISANSIRQDCLIRITVFVGGEGSWKSSEPVGMFIMAVANRRKDENLVKGISACISPWERISDRSLPPRIKAGANYLNARYAWLEAKEAGYEMPILLDRLGRVSEGPGSCIMIVRDGILCTPTTTSSILESITRDSILQLAKTKNIEVQSREIDMTELYLCDEIFACGTSVEITPIIKIGRALVSEGRIGEVTKMLLRMYMRVVDGTIKEYSEWRTSVY